MPTIQGHPEESQSVSTAGAPPRRGHLVLAAVLFTTFAVYGSLVRGDYSKEVAQARAPRSLLDGLEKFRQIPYLEIGIEHRADWVANILLFVPLGFFWLGSWQIDRGPRHRWLPVPIVLLACTGLSLAIEFTQQWFWPRTVSINDIIAEALGGVLGMSLWIAAGTPLVEYFRTLVRDPRPASAVHRLLQIYLFGFLFASVLPLDLTLTVGDFREKFTAGRIALVPFSHDYGTLADGVYAIVTDVVLWVPIGAWVVLFHLHHRKILPSLGMAVLGGMAIVCGVEFAQLFVFSRFTDTTSLITGAMGLATGAVLARYFVLRAAGGSVPSSSGADLRKLRPSLLWLAAIGIYAALLVLRFWYPFEFNWNADFAERRLAGFFRTPLESLYRGHEFKAITKVLQKTLLFAPLGAGLVLLSASLPVPRTIRRIAAGFGLFLAIVLATGIELGQVVIPDHTPDVTDVFVCTLGTVLGMCVAAWLVRLVERRKTF